MRQSQHAHPSPSTVRFEDKLQGYADCIAQVFANVKAGKPVLISYRADMWRFAYMVAQAAYKMGATEVLLVNRDPELLRLDALHLPTVTGSCPIVGWKESHKRILETDGTKITLDGGSSPLDMVAVDSRAVGDREQILRRVIARYYDEGVDTKKVRWTIAVVPSESWAKTAFPKLSVEKGIKALWEIILANSFHGDVARMQQHYDSLDRRCDTLNQLAIKRLHFVGPSTNFSVGLSEYARFCSAREKDIHGVVNVINAPSFEVFTSPDWRTVTGRVALTMPGEIRNHSVEGAWFEFEKGMVVDFGAKTTEGVDHLAHFFEDEHNRTLGEIALVGKNSLSRVSPRVLKWNTVLLENSHSHMAFGSALPWCVPLPSGVTAEQVGLAAGDEHHDVMISNSHTVVTAETRAGERVTILKNGDFTAKFK